MSESTTCQERVYSMSRDVVGHTCGRKVKDKGLCGLHLAAKRRREERNRAYDEERQQQRKITDETKVKVAKLREIGISAELDYEAVLTKAGYTGKVVVDPDQLLERLAVVHLDVAATSTDWVTPNSLVLDLDDESAEWLIQAARHWPGGMGHVTDEIGRALDARKEAR